jgi:hypothetical protein
MRNWILFSLPLTFFYQKRKPALPSRQVSKEIWHKGNPPYVSPFHARKTQPTRPSVSRLQTLLANENKHIENQGYSLSIAVNTSIIMLYFCLFNPGKSAYPTRSNAFLGSREDKAEQ